MPRGRPPKPTALHVLQGTHRRDRHGELPTLDLPPSARPPELTRAELDERAREIERSLRAIHGEDAYDSKRQDGR